MAFIPVPNGIKVCMRFSKASQQVCNIFYVTTTSTVDAAFLNTLGATIKTWWNSYMKAGTTTDMSLEAIELTDVSAPGAIGIEYTTGLPIAGVDSSAPMPNNVALAVKLSTGFTGRSARGRQYLAGLGLGSLAADNQQVAPAAKTALLAAYNALLPALATAAVDLVIASFVSGGVPRTTAVTNPVLSFFINNVLDSQRRRLPERGK